MERAAGGVSLEGLEEEVVARLGRASRGGDPGLGILLDLAKRGEFDPWNVDVVAVTDAYVAAVGERWDALELGKVGRLMFYAAALHHMKARAVAAEEAERALDASDMLVLLDEGEWGEYGLGGSRLRPDDRPLVYPDYVQDRAGRKRVAGLVPRERPLRKRGLTLVDLVLALKTYDERLAHREAQAEALEYDPGLLVDECVGSSHQDDLETDIVNVRKRLWVGFGHEPGTLWTPRGGVSVSGEGSDAPLEGEAVLDDPEPMDVRTLAWDWDDRVELDALVTPRRSRAATYLALLFLANDEEVRLEQERYYGELHVLPGEHFGEVRAGVPPEEEEAGVPETGVSETGVSETGVSETGVSETGVPENGVPENGVLGEGAELRG